MTTIVNSSNFEMVNAMFNEVRQRAEKYYAQDKFNNYASGSFCLFGNEIIKRFCEVYLPDYTKDDDFKRKRFLEVTEGEAAKVAFADNVKSVQCIPCLVFEFYANARDNNEGITNPYKQYLYKDAEGYLFRAYRHGSARQSNWGFVLYEDEVDYRDFLPCGYDDEHRPNYVGVLTDKKMAEWRFFLTQKRKAAEAERHARWQKVCDYLKKVKLFAENNELDFAQIGDMEGRFEKNGIRHTYKVGKDLIIREHIELTTYRSDFDIFAEISTGVYKAKKGGVQ